VRVLVTGSRTWTDETLIRAVLALAWRDAHGDMTVVHGDARAGADRIADQWAVDAGVKVERHPSQWRLSGKRAGLVRNAEMVAAGADLCLAFIRDGSRGASHCAGLAKAAGIPTRVYEMGSVSHVD
jgi:SLOG family YspA-like protein